MLDIWVITTDISEEKLFLQKSEVAEAKWVSEDCLRDMIKNGNFHNYGKEYFDTVFCRINDYRGAVV